MPSPPDVVLCFSHADRGLAEALAGDLQAAGLRVMWDEPIIAPDEDRARAAASIRAARAVIALWTMHSITNRWVIEDADEARRLGKLVSVAGDGVAQVPWPEPLYSLPRGGLGEAADLTRALRALGLEVGSGLAEPQVMMHSLTRNVAPGSGAGVPATAVETPRDASPAETAPVVAAAASSGEPNGSGPDDPAAVEPVPHLPIARPHLRLRRREIAPAVRPPTLGVAAVVAAVMIAVVLMFSSGLLQALTN